LGPLPRLALFRANTANTLRLEESLSQKNASRTSAYCIYAVDDAPCLTELYATLLEATGYQVRVFNDRQTALAAIRSAGTRPDLLITDFRGLSMAVDHFMHQCIALNPNLRILMASGFNESEIRLSGVRPDRFLQKPFTAEELRHEVRAALALE
jgi:DNA-binding NtrC family response regulator